MLVLAPFSMIEVHELVFGQSLCPNSLFISCTSSVIKQFDKGRKERWIVLTKSMNTAFSPTSVNVMSEQMQHVVIVVK